MSVQITESYKKIKDRSRPEWRCVDRQYFTRGWDEWAGGTCNATWRPQTRTVRTSVEDCAVVISNTRDMFVLLLPQDQQSFCDQADSFVRKFALSGGPIKSTDIADKSRLPAFLSWESIPWRRRKKERRKLDAEATKHNRVKVHWSYLARSLCADSSREELLGIHTSSSLLSAVPLAVSNFVSNSPHRTACANNERRYPWSHKTGHGQAIQRCCPHKVVAIEGWHSSE